MYYEATKIKGKIHGTYLIIAELNYWTDILLVFTHYEVTFVMSVN